MHLLSFISLLFVFLSVVWADNLPEGFFGKFSHDHSENFDEYMEAKGYGWLTRKLVAMAGVDKVFTKAGANTFNFENLTTKKDLKYNNIVLGQEFIGEGLDGSNHKITFSFRDGTLYEKHVPTDSTAEQKEDEYSFKLDGNTLVQTLEFNGVVAKRFFKRQ
ncbi:hypothetical protein PENTCL1PPCAC_29591 [Pristionchus entomophagus]|uniref:Cytosolic fatty-acid binding proteins domain-containing protein n=1 Tax=Pristionchus entomophagus TaxID=358040 RepID=A0AAV5UKC5_9BILA|nr:hypothetical protein PENTCL1PPCAC_29591 [Pristionchus entomophagus]